MNNLAFQIYGSTKSGIFQSTWKTDNISTGSSASNQITLPLISGGTYNFWIDWGDGSTTNVTSYSQIYSGETLPRTHTYTTAGIYTVRITGTIIGFGFNLTGDRLKITSILSWGKLRLGTGSVLTFYNCDNLNLNNVSDILDLTGTTSLYGFIFGNKVTTTINRINEWDFSSVTNMENSFAGTLLFNQPLSFNSVNVTNMSGLFAGTKAFNSDVTINTSKVTNMYSMFGGALVFNKPLSFDTSKVTSMSSMFYGATAFNSALNFDTSLVTTMSQMFRGALLFNQNIGSWNVSNITSFFQMFIEDFAFNNGGSDSIKNWQINTLSSVDMSAMFAYAYAFNQPIGLWNTSKVNSMGSMFYIATSFNNGLASGVVNQLPWDTSACTNMSGMFQSAPAFNSNLGTGTTPWDVSKVTSFVDMFNGASKFNNGDEATLSKINDWNIGGSVTSVNVSYMFSSAYTFNRNISSWSISKATSTSFMFFGAVAFNQPLSNWERVGSTIGNITNMGAMFQGASAFNQNIGNWNVTKVTQFAQMFQGSGFNNGGSPDIDNWVINTTPGANVLMNGMFVTTSFNQPLNNWNTSEVTNMSLMFGQSQFNNGLSSGAVGTLVWNTGKVTNMSSMFETNSSFNCNIGNWNVSSVTNFINFMLDKTAATFSSTNLDAIYNGWIVNGVQPSTSGTTNISFGGAKYTAAGVAGRLTLTSAPNNWIITDGGL